MTTMSKSILCDSSDAHILVDNNDDDDDNNYKKMEI